MLNTEISAVVSHFKEILGASWFYSRIDEADLPPHVKAAAWDSCGEIEGIKINGGGIIYLADMH